MTQQRMMQQRLTYRRAWVLLALLIMVPLAAPWLAPHDPNASLDLIALKSHPPTIAHPFGTDSYSRDVLSRVLHGSRISLAVSVCSVAVVLVLGTLYGALTTFAPRALSGLLRRVLDVALAMPRILLLLTVTAFAGSLSLKQLVLLIGSTGWFAVARQVTDELDALVTRDFAMAARAQGVRTPRLIIRHLLPHVLPVLMVLATFGVASTIALETAISYLGLGVQPPTASWGSIMRDGATVMESAWWLTVFPGMATILAALACNTIGDALREHLAPGHVPS
ncbi:MAG: ABC transporter permease [Gemmatimonadaceae bacterium]|nr:ABC transporter permease [Gemmatimonadaceae bacterium]